MFNASKDGLDKLMDYSYTETVAKGNDGKKKASPIKKQKNLKKTAQAIAEETGIKLTKVERESFE